MKIEILKSAKGNDQKQNKPAKPPKHRQAHMPKETKNEGKESYQKIGVQTQPNMKQPPSFIYFFFKS